MLIGGRAVMSPTVALGKSLNSDWLKNKAEQSTVCDVSAFQLISVECRKSSTQSEMAKYRQTWIPGIIISGIWKYDNIIINSHTHNNM